MNGLSRAIFTGLNFDWRTLAPIALLAGGSMLSMSIQAAGTTDGKVDIQPVANEKAQTQQEIDALHLKISSAQTKLQSLNKLASKNERALAQAQKRLSENQRKMREVELAQQKLKDHIAKTNQDIELAQAELDEQKEWVKEQLQDTYKHGQDNGLKLVLSGQSPSDTARLLKYHNSLHQNRQLKMDQIKRQQNHLSGMQAQQLESKQSLQTKRKEIALLTQQQKSLQKKFQTSRTKLAKSKTNTSHSLREMQARTQLLENLLQEMIIEEELARANQTSDFSMLKGRLQPPMLGQIHNVYKLDKSAGNGHWRGLWIEPKTLEPTEINSVAEGHVVFADWLLGYGLLTIIDHGHGYFSLYGHTQTLLREPGDWVSAQTPIAILKPSEAQKSDSKGLYFEIREQSQALNPKHWLANLK